MKNQLKRQTRVRAKLRAVSSLPRLSVSRTLRHISAQVIDDARGITLAASSSHSLAPAPKSTQAGLVGTAVAKALQKHKITEVVFDRGAYRFHGRVKALAEAARTAGLKF